MMQLARWTNHWMSTCKTCIVFTFLEWGLHSFDQLDLSLVGFHDSLSSLLEAWDSTPEEETLSLDIRGHLLSQIWLSGSLNISLNFPSREFFIRVYPNIFSTNLHRKREQKCNYFLERNVIWVNAIKRWFNLQTCQWQCIITFCFAPEPLQ